MKETLRILMIGAHPDDCEVCAGGFALKHVAAGNRVRFLSATNGCCGHQTLSREVLARRRRAEAEAVSASTGIEYEIWDIPDGEIFANLENRKRMVRSIRNFRPDLVVTHRPFDYHPDHRNTALLVRDASYLLIVPNVCRETPPLRETPPIAYFYDNFQPPFRVDALVSADEVMEGKFRMLDCHESQMYEWLPYTTGELGRVPRGREERFEWLKQPRYDVGVIRGLLKRKMIYSNGECKFGMQAEKYRKELVEYFGEAGRNIRYAEAFEISDYGGCVEEERKKRLFNCPPVSETPTGNSPSEF